MGALFKSKPGSLIGALGAASDVDTSEKRRAGLSTAGSAIAAAGGVGALLPFPPFAQIIGAGVAAVGAGVSIAAKLRQRGSLALAGDERAVADFARKAARWSSAKRARVASKLAGIVKKDQATLRKKKRGKHLPLKKKIAIGKLKLGVLVGLEANAKLDKSVPLVKGDTASVPVVADADPAANVDSSTDLSDGIPTWGWLLAGTAGAIIVVKVLRK